MLAQTPPANAEGVDKPQVSLLLSAPETPAAKAWVMPNLVGLSYSAASARMREMDLRVYAIVPQAASIAPVQGVAAPGSSGPVAPVAPVVQLQPAGVVVSQVPAAGMRVTAADNPRVKMSAGAARPAGADVSAATPAGAAAQQSTPAPVVRVTPPQ